MERRPHVKLNSAMQNEKSVRLVFHYGIGEVDNEKTEDTPDYSLMISAFKGSLERFAKDSIDRKSERNEELLILAHIDFIKIQFQNQFDINKYNQSWFLDFGLLGVNFSLFNHVVLFAVFDRTKFDSFLNDIRNFILRESKEDTEAEYRGKIKFIKDFKLLTTKDIINYNPQDFAGLMNFRLADFPLAIQDADLIFKQLQNYLIKRGCGFQLDDESKVLEVTGVTPAIVDEIAKNFDVLQSVTSSLSTVVSPSKLSTVEKTYGFTIPSPEDELPLIGILDTGISDKTPLSSILIEDESFNLTTSSSFVDNANGGHGHGTAVAALAALGRTPYAMGYRGNIPANAKLLSMKILDGDSGAISSFAVINLLQRAIKEYPKIKIFVLTSCYRQFKLTNEDFSTYSYELDKFSHQNDCLIFICTANNNKAADQSRYDLEYFTLPETNICSPSESMNNIIIGAAADNLKDGPFLGISGSREFPTLYTRKSHIDLTDLFPITKQNKHLFRPDVIDCGGDYEYAHSGLVFGTGENATMEVLSANPAFSFCKVSGTSFSTPLVANIAVQIQKAYPTIKAQTIKALIVNSAPLDAIKFESTFEKLKNKIAGHGVVDQIRSIYSTDNSITLVVEDEINAEEMKIIPLNFPSYLTAGVISKKIGLLRVTATLCFHFEPVLNNHLGYCPIQMAFAIFRNQDGDQILKEEDTIKSKLRDGWSQNNRWKSQPIPASNSQKISFCVGIKELESEGSVFKLAIHCRINSQMLSSDKYKRSHPFSMAITIDECLPEAKQTARLYDEMIAINEVDNIINIDAEADGEVVLTR